MSKKGASAWKLLMLLLIGFSGLYLCWIGVDHRLSIGSLGRESALKHSPNLCIRTLGLNPDFSLKHYPQPGTYSRGVCACSPVLNFVILSMQRSGSGWFETLLNSHPNISSHGEVFSVKSRRAKFSAILETLDSIYNLEWLSSASKNECTTAVGLKWMLNQGAMEYNREVSTYFKRERVSVIFLLRRNPLKRLVSVLANAYDRNTKLLNGTHKSHVHSEEEAETLAAYRPTINTEFLLAHLLRIQEITNDAILFFNSSRHTVIYYEDLVKNSKILKEVQRFLGVTPMKLGSQHVKIHRKPLRDQIENWEEVFQTLNGTKFENFLTDNDYL